MTEELIQQLIDYLRTIGEAAVDKGFALAMLEVKVRIIQNTMGTVVGLVLMALAPLAWGKYKEDKWYYNNRPTRKARLHYIQFKRFGNDIMVDFIEKEIKNSEDDLLINDWRKLQMSDHFYYMCTKWFADGDVHKYFNPFETPYDAFISYTNALNHLKEILHKVRRLPKRQPRPAARHHRGHFQPAATA